MSKSENHTLRLLAVRRMFALGGQQGGADAHLRLGDMEWYGQGKDANISAAVEHYKLAASRRSHQASFIMGSLYHLGIGVQRNLTLARRMYKKYVISFVCSFFLIPPHSYSWPTLLPLPPPPHPFSPCFLVFAGLIILPPRVFSSLLVSSSFPPLSSFLCSSYRCLFLVTGLSHVCIFPSHIHSSCRVIGGVISNVSVF